MENTTYLRACSKDGATFGITLDKTPFAQGASRFAFYGTLHNFRQHDEKKVVVKIFKEEYAKHLDPWTPDLTASKTAQSYAEHFNEEAKKAGILNAPIINFIMPRILQVVEVTRYNFPYNFITSNNNEYFHRGDYIAVEIFVEGVYTKYNSNGGYEDQSCEGSESLLAFSHWTWSKSNGDVMVCDLQGVKQGSSYILTDPAIHTKDRRTKAGTDLGPYGIKLVLAHHKCNDICRKLHLSNPFVKIENQGKRSKTYSFQIPKKPEDGPIVKKRDYEPPKNLNMKARTVITTETTIVPNRVCHSVLSPSQNMRFIIGNYRPTRIY